MSPFWKYLYWIFGLAFILWLLGLSVVYAVERIIWYDWSNLFFLFSGLDEPGTAHERYLALIRDTFGWTAKKLGMPLFVVMAFYSIGFLAIGVAGWVLLSTRKHFSLTLAYLPLWVFPLSMEIFFSTTDNLIGISASGIAGGLWFFSYHTKSQRERWIYLLVGGLFAIAGLYFAHPISGMSSLVFAAAVAVFYWAEAKPQSRKTAIFLLSAVLIAVFLKHTVFLTGYEAGKAVKLSTAFSQLVHLRESKFVQYFFSYYASYHKYVYFIAALVYVHAAIRKPWVTLLALGAAVPFILASFLYLSVYLYAGEHPAAMEFYAIVIPFSVVGLALLLVEQLPILWERLLYGGLFYLIFAFFALRLPFFTEAIRLGQRYTQRLVESCWENGERKILVGGQARDPYTAWYVWSDMPTDALLFSGLRSPDSVVAVVTWGNAEELYAIAQGVQHRTLIGPWWCQTCYVFDQMNPRYFRMPDSAYKLVAHRQDTSVYSALEAGKLSLEPAAPMFRIVSTGFARGYTVAEVDVYQTYAPALPCLPTDSVSVTVSYELYDANGQKVPQGYVPTFWERDIPKHYRQGVFIWRPEKKGYYRIQFGFLSRKHSFVSSGGRAWLVVE